MSVLITHIVHDGNFCWNLSFANPSLGEECLHLLRVLRNVVVIRKLGPIDIVVDRLVEVMIV